MIPAELDSRRLAVFRAVAEAGAITLAAKRLHLSQPAVTATVQQLEAALGKPLLERRARGVVPTEAGRRLLTFASRVSALLDEAALEVGAARAPTGPLVLGASTTVAAYIVPRLVADYTRAHGSLPVRVQVGNTTQVLDWVEQGLVPLGLVEGPPRAARVRLRPFIEDELLPLVATDAPRELAQVRRPSDLTHVPILWREPGSGTREVVERALRAQAKRKPGPHDFELGSSEAIKTALLLGLGVAFVSRFVIQSELVAGRLRVLPLTGLRIKRAFSFAYRGRELTGIAERFHDFALERPPSA
jgi:molybdate transport repressor ModE-like protein